MDVLSEIIAKKRERLLVAKDGVSFGQMQRLADEARRAAAPHALSNALRRDGINIIAEFKRRSPSKGIIRPDADLLQIVKSYEAGGAAAISVLTEEDYFSGSLDDLRTVKASIDLPVLRKDFVFDKYQVYESAAAGADAILLIVAALGDELLLNLRRLAEDELGLDALVEVHTSEELKRAEACRAALIGVNNRDLRTFQVSLETSLSLAGEAPPDALLVSESGLRTREDLKRLHATGYRGFLIGETLMRAENAEQALRNVRDNSPQTPRNVL
jgi:indole-3-glycerol phosphate synthase